jgi:hypothetical protein
MMSDGVELTQNVKRRNYRKSCEVRIAITEEVLYLVASPVCG